MAPTRVIIEKGEEIVETTFIDCLLDTLGVLDDHNEIPVVVNFQDNCLAISVLSTDRGVFSSGMTTDNPHLESYVAVLKHSHRCPLRELKVKQIPITLEDKHISSGVKIAAAVLVQSSDNFILLTKRPDHMRTYPGAWVPPGGHVEPHESLKEAVGRELTEEIGLELVSNSNNTLKVLGLWEAAYPPILEWGLPNRHHLIVYFNFISNETREQLQQKIKLDPKEVSTSVWLDPFFVTTLLNSTDSATLQNSIPTCEATLVNDAGIQSVRELPSTDLFTFESYEGRIAVGTKFALEEWLKGIENSFKDKTLSHLYQHIELEFRG
uniref:m7GpppN-mRNA hydrolase NUDT17 n=1 Tax=Strigamia maritima TaxID=126957 RepID=T1JG05_STRMM